MNRKQALAKIWRDTHRDYKGKLADGTKTIMAFASEGGGLLALDRLTDEQIKSRCSEFNA